LQLLAAQRVKAITGIPIQIEDSSAVLLFGNTSFEDAAWRQEID